MSFSHVKDLDDPVEETDSRTEPLNSSMSVLFALSTALVIGAGRKGERSRHVIVMKKRKKKRGTAQAWVQEDIQTYSADFVQALRLLFYK